MSVKVIGSVGLYQDNDDSDVVDDPAVLRQLHGSASTRDEEDAFAYYIEDPALKEIELTGGFIDLRFDAATGRLSVVTEYDSPRLLVVDELERLVEHTTDQWSDGLGESFECDYASRNRLDLDLAPPGQEVRVEQQ